MKGKGKGGKGRKGRSDKGTKLAWEGGENEEKKEKEKAKKGPPPEIDLIDAHFHQECSRFSRRYQTLKKLQNDFKLLFIFDGLDEAGGFREKLEHYIDEKLKSRSQMVLVTSRQPVLTSGDMILYKWFGMLPMSESQQLEYARRKLENNRDGNSHLSNMRLVAATEDLLCEPRYSKLTGSPLLLSYVVALLDSDSASNGPKDAIEGRLSGRAPRQTTGGFLEVGLNGLQSQQAKSVEATHNMPFRDTPSMFNLAIKLSIAHMEITSGIGDNKVEPKMIMRFLQKVRRSEGSKRNELPDVVVYNTLNRPTRRFAPRPAPRFAHRSLRTFAMLSFRWTLQQARWSSSCRARLSRTMAEKRH